MGRSEGIIFAFVALGETGQPARLAQCPDAVPPPRQDLVRIGLMADIPDQAVSRRIEHVVNGNREFDNAEAGSEMTAGL